VSARVDKVLIIGLGLIGGSLARGLKRSGFANHIAAYSYRDGSLKKGLELGVIDSYTLDLEEALAGADIIVIGAPTLAAAELLRDILPLVPANAVITDVASVKGNLVQAYMAARDALSVGTNKDSADSPAGTNKPSPSFPEFVPGHPIAGSEQSGVEASNVDLFVDHRVILTPLPEGDPAAVALIRAMWECTGAELVEMEVVQHDAILAATSHLPHVLAYSLVDALAQSDLSEDIFRFAAGGFRDFTRIASSDPVMWRDIAIANREQLLNAIDQFSTHLAVLRQAVDQSDSAALEHTFFAAKQARDAFVQKKESS
jgi:cyclohexadieny/prephenate dehydrogenase